MTRQQKSPKQRAEEALGVAERLYRRLEAKRDDLIYQVAQLDPEVEAAMRRRDFLANHPDLPKASPAAQGAAAGVAAGHRPNTKDQ